MSVLPEALKLVAAAVLAALVVAGVLAKAPRRWARLSRPRRLVVAALVLYALGIAAWSTGHLRIATILFGTGIGASSLGAWLSRAGEGQERIRAGSPGPDDPPSGPPFDWEALEREILSYTEREPVRSR